VAQKTAEFAYSQGLNPQQAMMAGGLVGTGVSTISSEMQPGLSGIGGMAARGSALLFLPKAAVARLGL
jgi:hypothetical protein